MGLRKRVTINFDPAIHRALRLKAAATERSVSEVVNEAVRVVLAEEAEDLAAIPHRGELARRLLGAGRKLSPDRDAVAELVAERAGEED